MRVCIVGHGPSVMMEPMGHEIDKFDKVIRLKRTAAETLKYPEFFGTKTDIIGGSFTIGYRIMGIGGAKEHWIFLDSRHKDIPEERLREMRLFYKDKNLVMDKALCDEWDERYRKVRDAHPISSEGHNHTSQGFKAIVYAAEFLKPDELVCVGFDNVASGQWTWSITRGPDWNNYPDHRFDIEHGLLDDIHDVYGLGVGFMMPEPEQVKEFLEEHSK